MSRLGKKPVLIPSGVKVDLNGNKDIKISSGSNILTLDIHSTIELSYDASAAQIKVDRKSNERLARAMHGTTVRLLENMIVGVTKGYEKSCQIYGTGFGIVQKGKILEFSVGFAKPAPVKIPDGIVLDIKTPNARGGDSPAEFLIKGIDKCLVGQFAASCRSVSPPEPYNGKGVRYTGEVVKRKAGKAFGG
jgi:large subunit ribosomal protein L6